MFIKRSMAILVLLILLLQTIAIHGANIQSGPEPSHLPDIISEGGTRRNVKNPDVDPRRSLHTDRDGNRIDDIIDQGHRVDTDRKFDIIVDYHRGIGPEEIADLNYLDMAPSFVSKYVNALTLDKVPYSRMKEILQLKNVAYIEYAPRFFPSLSVSAKAVRAKPSDEYSVSVWDDLELTGEDVTVAIIDTGVDDLVHQGLRGKFVAGMDATAALGSVIRNPDDGVGHGTHCAGIIMGTGSGSDNIGIAPDASLVDCKVGDVATLGSASSVNFMEALEWVKDNADIYNISVLSISMGTRYTSSGKDASSRLANEIVDAGVTVVVAIGNDEDNNNANIVASPGAADKVITVGAIHERNTVGRNDDAIASYSQRGPRPSDGDGDREDEFKPDIVAPGSDIMSTAHNTRDMYITFSGTSMATPHVAGTAALMEQAYSALTPPQIKSVLRHTAEKKGEPYSPGVSTKYNVKYGWGSLDAYGAVRRAKDHASSDLVGPSYVDSGSSAKISVTSDLLRTPYMEGKEEITWVVSYPKYFGKPYNIAVDSDTDKKLDHEVEEPYLENGMWHLAASARFDAVVGEIVEIAPRLEFFTNAPHVGEDQTFVFRSNGTLNGVPFPPDSHSLTVGQADQKADLAITSNDISFSGNPVSTGEEVKITANVSNVGKSDAYGLSVEFFDGNPASGIPLGTEEITVPAGEKVAASIVWTATPGPVHNIYVAADPEDEIDEVSETNNTASRPLRVKGGFNAPPVARLKANPGDLADIGEVVEFSGEDSTDADGRVTEWRFYFGDGNDSGWLPVDYADHRYTHPGNYSPYLIVKDNGGKESGNNATLDLTVKELAGGDLTFHLKEPDDLTLTKPNEKEEKSVPCPNGFTPYPFPGSPVGFVEYKEVGRWSANYPEVTVELAERISLIFWVRNTVADRGFDASFKGTSKVGGEVLMEEETEEVYFEPGGPPVKMDLYNTLTDLELKYRSSVEVTVECEVNGEGLELIYGSQQYPSGLTVNYLPVENKPPNIEDAPDVKGVVEEEVLLSVKAGDSDGEVVIYKWDMDNDHLWDAETEINHTYHVFEIPDEYPVNVKVIDDDGASRTVTLSARITEKDHTPPRVYIDKPEDGAVLTGPATFRGRVEVEAEASVSKVSARIDEEDWRVISREEDWEVEVNVLDLSEGEHLFLVKAEDTDGFASDIERVSFSVDLAGHIPEFVKVRFAPSEVTNSGEDNVTLTALVTDGDGPEDIATVEADLSSLGLGKLRCEREGPGTYTLSFTVPSGTPAGEKYIPLTASDLSGLKAETRGSFSVLKTNSPPEIQEIVRGARTRIGKGRIWYFVVRVTDDDGASEISEVYMDLSPIGGGTEHLNDDGILGDEAAGDGHYTLRYSLPELRTAKKIFNLTAVDVRGGTTTAEITVVFIAGENGEEKKEGGVLTDHWLWILLAFLLSVGLAYIIIRKYKSH